MSNSAEVVFEGWIDKRGSRLHGWKRRYARLLFDRIVFSIDEHTDARGYWLLRDFLAVIKEATRFRQHPNCLCLVHPTSSNRYFEPASESHVWLDCIQSLLQHITPQIVRTRRVQKWLDQSLHHTSHGSLELAEAATLYVVNPTNPNTGDGHDETDRKRAISQSSITGVSESSPVAEGPMGISSKVNDVSMERALHLHRSKIASGSGDEDADQHQEGNHDGNEDEDEESDVRSDEDDDNHHHNPKTHDAIHKRGSVHHHYAVTPGFT
eukprot:TRINITY_DN3804_c0_g1_i1.p1 TRINITY_DN3804_c0_g1~~TRINITY_DN3804_c0_g1_i1.p1  ORF type:complete len:267 (-),score=61.44 TRINITY_DN3804_c0_g1_i1:422-1222(-)